MSVTQQLPSSVLGLPQPEVASARPVVSRSKGLLAASLVGVLLCGSVLASRAGALVGLFPKAHVERFATVTVDRGEVAMVMNETGTLDSGLAPPIRCKVEAMLGRGGGYTVGGGGRRGSAAASRSIAPPRGRAINRRRSSAATANSSGGARSSNAMAASATAAKRPVIRSFTYRVSPHVPLRGPSSGIVALYNQGVVNNGDQLGSTQIIEIVEEGTPIKVGEIVCELDSSRFREEINAQEIRVSQALAWVEQAKTMVEVNAITQSEYRDGVYPQDLDLIRQYITGCEIELDRAQKTVEWSLEMRDAKLRTTNQYESDAATMVAAELNLKQAQGMFDRLDKFTRDRIFMTLEAKLEASRADMFAQDLAYKREVDRLKRLERMVENCTIRAPQDGIVVYANQSNAWGRQEVRIQEGVVVREGQAIFTLPEPTKLRAKARINESRISYVETGMPVVVKVDAFPDRPLHGKVCEIVPIPTPANGPFSDTKIYSAMISLDDAFDELRPGLSAEVVMLAKSHADVVRIPVEALRWVGLQAYAAITSDEGVTWSWHPVTLGLVNETHGEVLAGLKPGDHVIADPREFRDPNVVAER